MRYHYLSSINYFSATFFCFFSLVACSFKDKEKKPRKFWLAWLLLLFRRMFLHFRYSTYPFVRVYVKCPIHLLIGQGAVNVPSHHHSAILNDLLPCVFLALRNHFKHSFEDVLRLNSVNFLLHNLKIQPLITYIPLALHWIFCGV